MTASQSWNKQSLNRKQSMGDSLEVPVAATSLAPSNTKSNAGRVIRIINNADHTVQASIN